MINKIYLDMDGVFVDFKRGIFETLGPDISYDYATVGKFLSSLQGQECIDWWRNLKPCKDYMNLWEAVRNYIPHFLSAFPPSGFCDNESIQKGKKLWLSDNIIMPMSTYIHIVEKHEKKDFANEHSLLIDDDRENVREFQKAGGATILYGDPELAITHFESLMESANK